MKRHFPSLLILVLFLVCGLAAVPSAFAADTDGDGVDDSVDQCAATAAGAAVDADGCSIADLCPCAGPEPGVAWKNHGEYVSCVTHAANDFARAGLISNPEKGEIVKMAARSNCGTKAQEGTELVTIRTFRNDPDSPAGAGVLIFLGGVEVGATGADGTYTLELTVNTQYAIRALEVGLVGGRTSLFVEPTSTGTQEISIVMQGEADLAEDATLIIDGVAGGVLDSSFTALALHFDNPQGVTAALSMFDYLELVSPRDEDARIDVTGRFSLSADGRIVLDDVNGFKSALFSLPFGEVQIRAYGENARGFVYSGEAGFYVGYYSVQGTLVAPPSNPSLAVDGLTVTARFLQADVTFTATSDVGGQFSFSGLPAGNWKFSATTEAGGLTYTAARTFFVLSNGTISMTLRTAADILNNVPPFQSSGLAAAIPEGSAEVEADREAEDAAYQPPAAPTPEELAQQATAGDTASVSVTAGFQNVPVTAADTLTVPAGTEKIYLDYQVATAEYPFYVLSQSIFNDVWNLVVVASSGQQLFEITRQVNSQIFIAPFWQSNGSTGVISEEIDVSALTTAETQIVLSASATNIGDSILPTSVQATLDFEPTLRIRQINSDTVSPTRGDSSYYSIPRSGQSNIFSRKYTLKLTRPDMSTIDKVTAKVVRMSGGSELMTIVEEAPGMLVTEVDPETLDVTITMGSSNPSTIASTPPPVHNILHRFKVEATTADGTAVEDEKDSNPRRALWVLPDSTGRKGYRDPGGDGWSAKGTYEWLVTNASLVPLVDDISGEHARNIGHSTHYRGTDIDAYHFANLITTAANGAANYARLAQLTVDALGGDAAAKTSVTDFFSASRTGLSALAALNTVSQLIYARGAAGTVLPGGWAQTLMETGQLTDNMGRTLNLGIGTFSESKVRYRDDHNDHLHIDLNDAALNNSP